VTTDAGGRIDATILTQLDRMIEELMPAPVAGVDRPDGDADAQAGTAE